VESLSQLNQPTETIQPKQVTRDVKPALSRKIFIVHGHGGELKEATARLLAQLELEPRVCAVHDIGVEMPSDLGGILYIPYDGASGRWRWDVAREIRAAGYDVDLNKL
jgi:predicted nucleotide-binding protein